jgi:RHS repeat-associated protein
MQLASGSHIPDGLLAANALLSEKLHQGFAAPKSTLHQGFSVSISSTPLGIIGPLYDAGTGSRYTGKERDQESGLDYFGARMYASAMGRFMSPDTFGGHLEDPQTLNRYSYVGNNPLSRTDPDGHDFYLGCTVAKDGSNASTCQSQRVGGTDKDPQMATVQGTTNKNGNFTATQIGNDSNGNLVDKTTGTGAYTGTFDGKNVTLTNSQGQQSTGDWVQGTNPTSGIVGGGDLGPRFQFTFMDHGADQTLNFNWHFDGTQALADAILKKAGYNYFRFGTDFGYDEYRLPAPGRNSTHFLMEQSPMFTIPSANGKGHSGEYYPGVQHTVCDWMGLC